MENVTVPYRLLQELIEAQFLAIKNGAHKEDYASINFVVADEQMFAKLKNKSPNTVYIVVRYGKASINFGQATLPLELAVLGMQNEIEKTKDFLNEYVNTYNLLSQNDVTQLYMTPNVSLNFNEVYNGFRTLFSITATFIIGDNTIRLNKLEYVYIKDGKEVREDIGVISFNDITENNLNPQPYPDTYGRARSYGNFQAFAFSITTYADASKQFIQDIMRMKYDFNSNHQNDTFHFEFTFDNFNLNGQGVPQPVGQNKVFKCKSADFNQKIGEIPAFVMSFSL